MNRRGQLSIINLLSWLVLIVIGVVLTPIIKAFTKPLIASAILENATGEVILISAIPIVMWILIIGVLVLYATPRNGAPPLY